MSDSVQYSRAATIATAERKRRSTVLDKKDNIIFRIKHNDLGSFKNIFLLDFRPRLLKHLVRTRHHSTALVRLPNCSKHSSVPRSALIRASGHRTSQTSGGGGMAAAHKELTKSRTGFRVLHGIARILSSIRITFA